MNTPKEITWAKRSNSSRMKITDLWDRALSLPHINHFDDYNPKKRCGKTCCLICADIIHHIYEGVITGLKGVGVSLKHGCQEMHVIIKCCLITKQHQAEISKLPLISEIVKQHHKLHIASKYRILCHIPASSYRFRELKMVFHAQLLSNFLHCSRGHSQLSPTHSYSIWPSFIYFSMKLIRSQQYYVVYMYHLDH